VIIRSGTSTRANNKPAGFYTTNYHGVEISPAQCRAARALLNWTQETLAVKTGVTLKIIRAFENERTKPLGVTLAAIKQALEKGGIEFFEDDGLRFKK
jgi:transcriptional regulator with XRE-family HTH domain